jgi:PDZ domain-containing secreted protein
VRTPDEMLRTIASKDVNTEVQVEVVRLDGARKASRIPVTAKLTERPDETIINEIHSPDQGGRIMPEFIGEPDAPVRNLGLEMVPFSSSERRLWGLEVKAVAPGSPAALQGLAPGDIITTVNGRSVRSQSDFMAAIAQPVRGNHVIRFRRGEEQRVAIIRGAGPRGEESPLP